MLHKNNVTTTFSFHSTANRVVEVDTGAMHCGGTGGTTATCDFVGFSTLADGGLGGLRMLWKAAAYARTTGGDGWNFAVELSDLRGAGLTANDLRWMKVKKYIEIACEVDAVNGQRRAFKNYQGFHVTSQTCVILTSLGVEFVSRGLADSLSSGSGYVVEPDRPRLTKGSPLPDLLSPLATGGKQLLIPSWDIVRRELKVGRELVKRFRVPAPNQEYLLTVFQEEEWPVRIDDPFPPRPSIEPKRQLHATISSLNRRQLNRLIDFRGDGTGTGAFWGLHPNGQAAGP